MSEALADGAKAARACATGARPARQPCAQLWPATRTVNLLLEESHDDRGDHEQEFWKKHV